MSLPADVVTELIRRGLRIATAESLTAGLLAATIADVPGASGTLQGGVVAYQNEAKERLLGVDPGRLASHGAVDAQVAAQMAEGARRALGADIGVATTGVAGPEPHQGRAVGTVYLGIAGLPGAAAEELHLDGDREGIRRATVQAALHSVLRRLGQEAGS
ncbi:MAG: CinA family protein [Micrococcus sp.]|nr:CinA family protein [Micrococcus sp.]